MLLATSTMNPTVMIVLYVVIFGGIFYFMGYRPQKKEKKRVDEMMAVRTRRIRRSILIVHLFELIVKRIGR